MRSAAWVVGVVAVCLAFPSVAPAQKASHPKASGPSSIPDFSGSWDRVWVIAGTYDAPPAGVGPGPVMVDPEHPHSGHQEGEQATPWIADFANPILKPLTREIVKRISDNENIGMSHDDASARCWPSGVPQILNLRDGLQILQTKTQLTFLYSRNQQVRQVYMNVPHSKTVTPSWYGESIGTYEGNTLVVDTIGVSDKSEADRFGSPHSDTMHVVERYTPTADGKTVKVLAMVDDPEFFTMRWYASADYQRGRPGPSEEIICAENNRVISGGQFPVPTAAKADF